MRKMVERKMEKKKGEKKFLLSGTLGKVDELTVYNHNYSHSYPCPMNRRKQLLTPSNFLYFSSFP